MKNAISLISLGFQNFEMLTSGHNFPGKFERELVWWRRTRIPKNQNLSQKYWSAQNWLCFLLQWCLNGWGNDTDIPLSASASKISKNNQKQLNSVITLEGKGTLHLSGHMINILIYLYCPNPSNSNSDFEAFSSLKTAAYIKNPFSFNKCRIILLSAKTLHRKENEIEEFWTYLAIFKVIYLYDIG